MQGTLIDNRPDLPKDWTVASLTVENYVKAIYQIAAEQREPAATGQMAAALGVLPGTVTSMLKTLSESSLATYTPYEGVSLTPAGNALALRVLRRHRLIELFLSRTLDLDLGRGARRGGAHGACRQRLAGGPHRTVSRLSRGRSARRPDPDGRMARSRRGSGYRHLAACREGERFRLMRVADQSPEFLRYL